MRIETPPFTILALARFSPALDTDSPPIVTIDSQSLDDGLTRIAPNLDIPVDKELCPDANVSVSVSRMADLRPKNVVKNSTFLRELHDAKAYVDKGGSPSDLEAKFPKVAQVITIPGPGAASKPAAKETAIDDILSMVDTGSDGGVAPGSSGAGSVQSQIEHITGRLLSAIFNDPDFRTMEAAWRGLELLTRQAPSGSATTVQITLVPLPQGDCIPVLDSLEQTQADTPPDLVVADLSLSNTPHDMAVLERIMDLSESLLAPTFTAIGPQFLEIDSWHDLSSAGFIPSRLEGAEYGRWKTLKERSGAGWITLGAGGVMARAMHRPEPGFATQGLSEDRPLWVSSAWALGALCARSVATLGRPTRFSDRSTTFLDEMPMTDTASPSPLQMLLDTEHIKDFKQAGILPLAGSPGRDQVFVIGSITMDGGPLNFRLFLSQLTGFLIAMATNRRHEIIDLESDLAQAVTLFIQAIGLPAPPDVTVTAHEEQDGMTPLEITLTPDQEILPGGQSFTFGFGW